MALKLRVTSYGSQPMGAAAEHVFDHSGGSIGRAKDSGWCLPDPERVVSNTHAFIRYANGEFYFRDSSTNGTLLNSLHMSKGDERPLRSGDFLRIGPYEITVEFAEDAAETQEDHSGRRPPSLDDLPPNLNVDPGATLDPLELLGKPSGQEPMNLPPEDFDFGAQANHSSPESMGFEPPAPIPDTDPMPVAKEVPPGIPENWDETGFESAESVAVSQLAKSSESADAPAPAPDSGTATLSVPAATMPPPAEDDASGAVDDRSGVTAVLVAAGMRPEAISNETYETLGKILKVVIEGTVDVLRARAQIKDQFRVPATMLKPVENNPLKHSINAQDALHNLFGTENPGFQSPVDAFQESYEDIKAHQLAMIAGMRAAYKAMLEFFNPNDLEAEFDKALKRSVLGGVLNKTKYWDLYEDLYESLAKDPDSSFHKLFGDDFSRAYEEQMQRLLTVRKR